MAASYGRTEVRGLANLRRTLRKAGDDLSDLRAANRRAAEFVKGRTQAPRQTGALQRSLRGSGTKTAAIVRAGGASVPYANPIHWGWGRRHIAANPFLTRTAAATEPQWLPIYEAEIQAIVSRVRGI